MAHEGQPRRKDVLSIPFLCRLKLAADGTLPAEHRRLRADAARHVAAAAQRRIAQHRAFIAGRRSGQARSNRQRICRGRLAGYAFPGGQFTCGFQHWIGDRTDV